MQEFFIIFLLIFVGQILGSLFGLIKKPSKSFILYSLTFAASIMIGVSLFELIPEALAIASYPYTLIGFVLGLLAIIAVDRTLPHINPELGKKEKPSVERNVTMLVVGIALHNIPEGLAIGAGFALDPALGLLIAAGIALQDIPENLATIVPLYALTGNKLKSFAILIGTVLFEAAGFLLGCFLLCNMPASILSMALAAAAAIMLYISFEELLPGTNLRENPYKKAATMLIGLIIVAIMILLL